MTINLEKSIDVSAPIEDVYNVWSQFSSFPDFMGSTDDTEITEQEENKFISWQTLKGVRSSATVRFTPLDDGHGTTVTVSVHYPNGLGAQTTVQDVNQAIESDLSRFAKLLQGQPAPGLQSGDAGPDDEDASQNVGADVLGPAYAMSQPSSPPALTEAFSQSLEKNLDTAASLWINAMLRAFVAPLKQMQRLTEQLDVGFGGFMWGGLERRRMLIAKEGGDWSPSIDVTRDGQSVQVTALLPGATEQDIQVEIRDGQLLISGECHFSEDGLSSTHFNESIDLLNAVDSRSVEARVDAHGRLVISLQLYEEETDVLA